MAATTSAFDTASLAPPQPSRSLARLAARPSLVAAGSVLVALLVGAGDWVTGIELPFTILYLVPIGAATWFLSRRSGLAIAIFATAFSAASLAFSIIAMTRPPLLVAPRTSSTTSRDGVRVSFTGTGVAAAF
jgi:hypothetical protein